jgi:4-amino-4-deoxy-L-arabinose transferase-like glycosyltransferase
VNESTAAINQNAPARTAARIGWAILIVATLYVCYFSHLGAIGFVGPDEPRYAWIARDMAETGDWVTPRLYGRPWFEKPVLYYWGAALCFKLFGVNEAAARLPSAISALLATLAMAWFALRLYGAETARWLLLLLPTTVGMIGFSHAAATDMPFSGMLTIAMVCAAVVLGLTRNDQTPVLPHTPWLALVLFGFFLGLAVLAKGPAAIILCGGAIFFWALLTKRWRDALRLFHPAAIAAFCLTALPWYILCARGNPDFFRIFIIEHNFKRYLTPEFQHIQPFWYYLPILLIGLAPWFIWLTWHALPAFRKEIADLHWPVEIFVVSWAIFPLLFFTLSKSKLPGYILPSILPLGLLLATAVTQSMNKKPLVASFAVMGSTLLYLAFVLWVWLDHYSYPSAKGVHLTVVIGPVFVLFFTFFAGIGGLASMVVSLAKRPRGGQILALIAFLFMVDVAYDSSIKLNLKLSPRSVASDISAVDADRTYSFKMQRGWLYGLNFYLHRDIPEWTPSTKGSVIVITSQQNSADLKRKVEIIRVISDFSAEANILEVRSSAGTLNDRRQPQ